MTAEDAESTILRLLRNIGNSAPRLELRLRATGVFPAAGAVYGHFRTFSGAFAIGRLSCESSGISTGSSNIRAGKSPKPGL
jgi:hypothetical protein